MRELTITCRSDDEVHDAVIEALERLGVEWAGSDPARDCPRVGALPAGATVRVPTEAVHNGDLTDFSMSPLYAHRGTR
jgi:hypothetical protein